MSLKSIKIWMLIMLMCSLGYISKNHLWDFLIVNELVETSSRSSLSFNESGEIEVVCEAKPYNYDTSSRFLRKATEGEIEEKVVEFAENVCGNGHSIHKMKNKHITINPGEYYNRASVSLKCSGGIKSSFEEKAKDVCKSLLTVSTEQF